LTLVRKESANSRFLLRVFFAGPAFFKQRYLWLCSMGFMRSNSASRGLPLRQEETGLAFLHYYRPVCMLIVVRKI